MIKNAIRISALMMVALAVAGHAAETETSLYARLGGQPAIQAVADRLVERILADNRINTWFAHAAGSAENKAAYKSKLTDFLCQATGGGCVYKGMDMSVAHHGRGVTNDAFGAVVEDLVAVLDQLKVPAKEKGEVLAMLGPLQSVIVQK